MTTWRPRQCLKDWASSYECIAGGVTKSIFAYCLDLAPPIATGSTILDVACGTGLGVEEIMEHAQKTSYGTYDLAVSAINYDPSVLSFLDAKVQKHHWQSNVKTAVMDAQSLEFPDNQFSHSIMNFAMFIIPDPVRAASELYRTLRPGSTALVTTWAELGHGDAAVAASKATRQELVLSNMGMPSQWHTSSHLESVLHAGGFAVSNIQILQREDYISVMDLNDWAQHAWTWFGRPADGWKQRDEDLWDTAIVAYVDAVRKSKGFHIDKETGMARVRIVANVAVATKQCL